MNIFFSGNYFEAINIKNILEKNNIDCFLENQMMSVIQPYAVSAGGQNPVNIKIAEGDFELAKKVVDEYVKD